MSAPARAAALIFPLATFCAGPLTAADDVSLEKDLRSVIILLGLPCDQVVIAEPVADNDHIATCKDGNRYHVFVSADGRVVADSQ